MAEETGSATTKPAIAVLLLTSLLFAVPLLTGYTFFGHDLPSYLIHAQQAGSNLRDGLLLPSWAGDLNNGFGGPVLLFYPPLVAWLHGAGLALGFPLLSSIGFLTVLAHALSGLTFFFAIRSRSETSAALPAALVYMVAPYRAIDLFMRTALAEHWAFVFPPIILLAGWHLSMRWNLRCALTAIGAAGILLSNLPQAILFSPLLAVWLFLDRRTRGRRRVLVAGALLGAGLASFALFPQAVSDRMLRTGLITGAGDPLWKPSSNMLFTTAEAHGAKPVGQDPGVRFNHEVSSALAGTSMVAFLAFVLTPRARRGRDAFWIALTGVMVAITFPVFGAAWDAAPILSRVQFPWRLCGPITLAAAILVGAMVDSRRAVGLVLLSLALALPFSFRSMIPRTVLETITVPAAGMGRQFPDPRAVFEASQWNSQLSNATLAEPWFVPRGLSRETILTMVGAPTALGRRFGSQGAAVMEGAPSILKVESWSARMHSLKVSSPRGGKLLLRVIAFPGISCRVDGQPATAFRDRSSGLVAVRLPAGAHTVDWYWRAVGPFHTGRVMSAVSVTLLLLLLVATSAVPRYPVHPKDVEES